jgi:GT2 family glycosyltransferase
MPDMHSITAVIVLYQRSADRSPALQSLLRFLGSRTDSGASIRIIVYDNSPKYQSTVASVPPNVTYCAAPENGGLAPAYNLALRQALEQRDEWLLLLDQDTELTESYLQELVALSESLSPDQSIAAVVPKLTWNGRVHSPEDHLFDQLRSQFQHRDHGVSLSTSGIQAHRLVAYNSGALMRVRALEAIGGFPSDFWLDFLDHAVFHMFAARGCYLYIMQSILAHPLAHTNRHEVPLWRERNVLSAQTLFVKRFGSFMDKLRYRLYLLRMSRQSFHACSDRRVGLEKMLQAIFLRVPALAIGGANG